jgi:hypothetical protein
MGERLLSLESIRAEFATLHEGVPFDNVPTSVRMRAIGLFRQILSTPGLFDFIHEYMIGQAEKED